MIIKVTVGAVIMNISLHVIVESNIVQRLIIEGSL